MAGIAIVGPHRSGTSAVAGVVHALGAYMGDNLLPPSKTNPRGYFEEASIVDLHNEMLGGNWFRPNMATTYELMDRYETILATFMAHDFWAIKDPRLCYCLPALLRVCGNDLKVITVHRDPWNSAKSLTSRDRISYEDALDITLAHAHLMLDHTTGIETLRIKYLDLITDPRRNVLDIIKFVGLTGVDSERVFNATQSIDPSLAHWELIDAKRVINTTTRHTMHGGVAESG